ncbi:DUF3039 domain-containing protein [Pseudarthrobacter psychrotolerans]|uniref:DUF3039 domain-containing protein n=1 Tax=Pseudarthrobacter psychrotolerans TaxID=2697569 RepID=A0A6P1NPB4_9MICC|nr:DUF3039 domain-containing protein [Pseudarthrobacter psychrotolerans]QHK19382.1 DUF3039 domain-containing protein [Pseudarthrobacter psychrotolerans]
MSTKTLPAIRPVHNFNPVLHHYYKGRDIDRSQVTREPITALCGEIGAISAAATGQQSNGTVVVCPMCATTYAGLPRRRPR